MGLWDEFHQNWSALAVRTGQQGQLLDQSFKYISKNPSANTHTQTGAIILQSFEGQSHPRHLLVGQAEVQVTDDDWPNFGWVIDDERSGNRKPSEVIPYEVTDSGLGVNELRMWAPAIGGGTLEINSWVPCFGNVSHPCPRTVTQNQVALNSSPASMPQGEDWVAVGAVDPIGHWSGLAPNSGWEDVLIKVDHTAPELALSGSLTERGPSEPTGPNTRC